MVKRSQSVKYTSRRKPAAPYAPSETDLHNHWPDLFRKSATDQLANVAPVLDAVDTGMSG